MKDFSIIMQRIQTHLEGMQEQVQLLHPRRVMQEMMGDRSFDNMLQERMQTPAPQAEPKAAKPLAGDVGGFDEIIDRYAGQFGLDSSLVKAVMQVESGGRPGSVSPKGALGLMQLMPDTAASLGVDDPLDPGENIRGGSQYLRSMLDRYGDLPQALAAYNAGPGAVDEHGGVPPYQETQDYVRRVLARARDLEPRG